MGTNQLVFGFNLVYSFISLIVCLAYRFVYLGQLTKVMQIGIHLLVTDNGKYFIILKFKAFILIKDGLTVLVQFYAKAVCGLDGCDFNVIFLHIALAKIGHI